MTTIIITEASGKKHSLSAETHMSIMENGENAGIDMPFSCRSGACSTCLGKVTKGIHLLEKEKFGDDLMDTEMDEILTCIGGLNQKACTTHPDDSIEITLQNS